MAEETQNILDQAKAQEAAVLPRLKDQPILDYGYRFLQNLMNKITADKLNGGFGGVKSRIDESIFSNNPYFAQIKAIVNQLMKYFTKHNVTNADIARFQNGKYKNYELKNSGIDVPSDIQLENASDANTARHMFTNYDDLSSLFTKMMVSNFGHNRVNYKYLSVFRPNTFVGPGGVSNKWKFGLKDNFGNIVDPYELVRNEVHHKMAELFPYYVKALDTPMNRDAASMQNILDPNEIEYPPMFYRGKILGHPLSFMYNNPDLEEFKLKEKGHVIPEEAIQMLQNDNVFDATDPANIPGFLLWLENAKRHPIGRPRKDSNSQQSDSTPASDSTPKSTRIVDSNGTGTIKAKFDPSKFRR